MKNLKKNSLRLEIHLTIAYHYSPDSKFYYYLARRPYVFAQLMFPESDVLNLVVV